MRARPGGPDATEVASQHGASWVSPSVCRRRVPVARGTVRRASGSGGPGPPARQPRLETHRPGARPERPGRKALTEPGSNAPAPSLAREAPGLHCCEARGGALGPRASCRESRAGAPRRAGWASPAAQAGIVDATEQGRLRGDVSRAAQRISTGAGRTRASKDRWVGVSPSTRLVSPPRHVRAPAHP